MPRCSHPKPGLHYDDYKTYVDRNEDHCLFCDAPLDSITRNITSQPRGSVIATNRCRKCDAKWDVEYKIASVTIRHEP